MKLIKNLISTVKKQYFNLAFKSYELLDKTNPFDEAVLNNNTEFLIDYIKKGADINFQNSHGTSALHRSAQLLNFNAVYFLIKQGAKPDTKDKYGNTPLMKIAQKCSLKYDGSLSQFPPTKNKNEKHKTMCLKVAQLMIDAGSDVNSINQEGKSVLSEAVNHVNEKLTISLLAAGADILKPNNQIALAYAMARDSHEIIQAICDSADTEKKIDFIIKNVEGTGVYENKFRTQMEAKRRNLDLEQILPQKKEYVKKLKL